MIDRKSLKSVTSTAAIHAMAGGWLMLIVFGKISPLFLLLAVPMIVSTIVMDYRVAASTERLLGANDRLIDSLQKLDETNGEVIKSQWSLIKAYRFAFKKLKEEEAVHAQNTTSSKELN